MAAYAYTAINAQGLELTGEVHAPTAEAAREQLRVRGLLAELLRELPAGASGAAVGTTESAEGVKSFMKSVKPRSLQVFSRQFATMINAGLNVVASLRILEEQTTDTFLAAVIADVRTEVENGALLSQALAKHPKVFSRLYVSMVEAGEAAGILDEVLDRLATQIEKEANIKRRVKGAMIYPTLVLSFSFVVLTAMLLFIVPIFQKLYTATRWNTADAHAGGGGRLRSDAKPLVPGLPGDRARHLRVLPLEEERRAAARPGIASSCGSR